MVMLKINDINDYESLPLTKWNIKQPNMDENRENATETGNTQSTHRSHFPIIIVVYGSQNTP